MTVTCLTHICNTQTALIADVITHVEMTKWEKALALFAYLTGEALVLLASVFVIGILFAIAGYVYAEWRRFRGYDVWSRLTLNSLAISVAVSIGFLCVGCALMFFNSDATSGCGSENQSKFIARNQEFISLLNGSTIRSNLSYAMSPFNDKMAVIYGRQAEKIMASGATIMPVSGKIDGAASSYIKLISFKGDTGVIRLSKSENPDCVKDECVLVASSFLSLSEAFALDPQSMSPSKSALLNGEPAH